VADLHNAITYGSADAQACAKTLGMRDNEEGVARLGETFTPTLEVRRYDELAFLRRCKVCAGFSSRALDAANLSYVQLLNPANSSYLVEVTAIYLQTAVTESFILEQFTTVLGTLQAGQSSARDSRWENTGVIAQLRNGVAAAAIGTPIAQIRLLAATTWKFDQVHVLHPGNSVAIRGAAINTAVTASFFWRERIPLARELARR